jgi:hypothetical protein
MVDREELGDRLLAHGLRHFEGTLASGEEGNIKLEADYKTLAQNPQLLEDVVEVICEEADPYKPDFFVGVPDGATDLAQRVAREYGKFCVNLRRASREAMDYATGIDRDALLYLEDGVLVEDVLRRGTNTERAISVNGLRRKLKAEVVVFNRGDLAQPRGLALPVRSVVHRPIPAIVSEDNPIWQFTL